MADVFCTSRSASGRGLRRRLVSDNSDVPHYRVEYGDLIGDGRAIAATGHLFLSREAANGRGVQLRQVQRVLDGNTYYAEERYFH